MNKIERFPLHNFISDTAGEWCKDTDVAILEEVAETDRTALKQIAETPDCLFKSDATKMRKIAREALK